MERVRDCTVHYVGFNFHCGWPTRGIIGEKVMGRYIKSCHFKRFWSEIEDCEPVDWDRSICGLVDDECKRCELVLGEWGVIYLVRRHPVCPVDAEQVLRAEQKEYWSNTSKPAC